MGQDALDAEGLLQRVRSVVPLIAERAAEAETQRKPDDDVIAALERTGVFRSFVPRDFGGYEIDLDVFVAIGTAVSEACPSTGWISTFYMEHNWLLGKFPDELQTEVFGSQPYVLAPGSVNPSGRAVEHSDCYELSGHWQFGTGVTHADWVLLSGMIEGQPPMPRMFLAPVSAVEVKDTWHVDGMCATGSRDIVADSIRIPKHRVSRSPADLLAANEQTYLARIPLRPMLSLTAAIPAVGCARRATQLFRERCADRVMFGSAKKQSEMDATAIRLGSLTARARMAETCLVDLARTMTAIGRGERDTTDLETMGMRVTIAQVVRMCRDVVRDVIEASGAKAHFLDNELQRIHRDIHMVAAHTVFDLDLVAGDAGRAMLTADTKAAGEPSTEVG